MQFAHSSAQSLVHRYIGEYRITNEVWGAKVQGRSGMECAECAMRWMSQPLTAQNGFDSWKSNRAIPTQQLPMKEIWKGIIRAWTDIFLQGVAVLKLHIGTLDMFFSSNHNIHKSLCSLCFWASDPLIDGFY